MNQSLTLTALALLVLFLFSGLFFVGNDMKNDEIDRIKTENKMHENMVEVLADKLNLEGEEFAFTTVTRGQLYKTIVKNKTYEIYIDKEGNVIGVSEIGTIIE